MNYIQEIKAFNEWLVTNPTITTDDIALWYALMNLNNSCGWKSEFTVAISTIVDRTRLSRSAIYRSRNRLLQSGRIRVRERKGNQCTVYEIIPFVSHHDTQIDTVSHMGTHPGTQPGTQTGTHNGTITKLKETKQNKKTVEEEAPLVFVVKLKGDQLNYETLGMAWGIDRHVYERMADGFQALLSVSGKNHPDYGEYKRHFFNWGAKKFPEYKAQQEQESKKRPNYKPTADDQW